MSRSEGLWIVPALALVVGAALVEPTSVWRGLVAAAGAALLLWPAAERLHTRGAVVLALVALTLSLSSRLPEFLTTWQVRVWNVYHYYLGAKYFEELGYTGLYDATLLADAEGESYWREIRRVRNLETYEVEDRAASARRFDPLASFEEARWREFRDDVEALSRQLSPKAWQGIFVDRGYNATPLWTVLGGGLARLAPADEPLALKLLCSLDLALLAGSVWLLGATFGPRAAALVVLLLTLSPVNVNRLVGGFLQYDWFCAVAVSACLYRRRHTGAAAAALAYAVMTRIFPLLFALAGVLPLMRGWWTAGRPPRRQLRFLGSFSAWCLIGLVLGLANGRGVDGWREFAEGIALHRESHLVGERRVGLEFLFTQELGSPALVDERREKRLNLERQQGLYRAAAAVLMAAFAAVAWRQRSWNARLLGMVPVFALLVTSRYYWSYLALLPLVGGRRGPPAVRARWLAAGQLLVFAGFYAYDAYGGEPYAAYLVLNILLLPYLVFLLGAVASRRGR